MLILKLAIFVLYLAIRNVKIWLQFLELSHAYNILAYLYYFELQFLVLNCLRSQFITKILNLELIFLYVWLLLLSLGFKLELVLLKCINLHKIVCNFIL